MDPLLTVILTRAAERMLVILAGILCIYVGYRLFALVPEQKGGESRLTLPGGASFFASKVAPGVFFALFGTGLIGYSATRPVSFSPGPGLVLRDSSEAARGEGGVFSGVNAPVAGNAGPAPPSLGEARRAEVIGTLNAWLADLPEGTESGVRLDRLTAVKDAKLALLREAWDQTAWGDYDLFHRWVVEMAQTGPPPDGSEAAAALFDRASP